MHHRMLVTLLTALGAANAVLGAELASDHWSKVSKRQDGPTAPDTDKDCTYWDTVYDSSMNCQYFEDGWGLTHAQFVEYNPSVKDDCSGIKVGNSYCVEILNGLPRPTTKPAATPTKTSNSTPSPTGIKKPSPTQSGLIDTCIDFYFAVKDDRCDKIVAKFGTFTFDDFVKWNPAVGPTCSGIWQDTYYCIAIPGTPTARPSASLTTPTPTAAPTGVQTPSPIREGMVANCNKFHFVVKDENCNTLVQKYGTFTLAQFLSWNPSVGSGCGGLWQDTYFCVGVPGTAPPTTTKPSTTLATSTRPASSTWSMPCILKFFNGQYLCAEDPASCNPNAPPNTQPSPICLCKKWHEVGEGDNCNTIIAKYGISRSNFDKWNSAINNGGDCKTLWKGYNVCVGA